MGADSALLCGRPPVGLQDVDDADVQQQTLPAAIHGRDPAHPGETGPECRQHPGAGRGLACQEPPLRPSLQRAWDSGDRDGGKSRQG